ncbi:putative calcium-transporting ATPase 13, plasma membrane-type [Morella rubra]|uniref:Putative calcium-transporting ATPase 13, plasma membrane-type n=1 Tax=Morella rubra TaxID=262757 RepID=A0A6A1US55_9ROSI|nr:putative calcium-transporting ATPase 13, plasma membrane-type [Morella rubra]
MSPPRCRKSGGIANTSDQEDWHISKIHKRRWRLAFTAIHFTRVLTSLSKQKVLDKNGPLLRSLSYVVVDSIPVIAILVVAESPVSNFRQSRQFNKLFIKSSDIKVEVERDGRCQPITIFEVVVGDIVYLEISDQIPADGVFVEGHSLKVDESSRIGENDHIEVDESTPFMLSGTKVLNGFGFMLVTYVGINTVWDEMMDPINWEFNEETPLQERLNKLTLYIGKVGLATAALVLAVMFFCYFTKNTRDDTVNREKQWVVFNLGMAIEEVKHHHETLHVEVFNSQKKRSGVLVKRNREKYMDTHWKGAAEMILAMHSTYYDREGMLKAMDEEERLQLETIIKNMAAKRSVSARVRLAVKSCKAAGVNIKIITGDNMHIARVIAIECGILNPKEDLDNEAVVFNPTPMVRLYELIHQVEFGSDPVMGRM